MAIITGGGSGIGRAVAIRYALEGALCVVADLDIKNAESTSLEIRKKEGEALSIQMDVSQQKDIQKTLDISLKSTFFLIMQLFLKWLHFWIPLVKALIASLE